MIIYIYDENTGEFLNEYSPQPNPKKGGEFLTPPNSTDIEPVLKEGFVNVFSDGEWIYVHDYRGHEIINPETGEKDIMKEIGNLPDGFILYADYILTDEYRLELEKREKLQTKQAILSNIEALDKKRIRAICEPETREDGITWLEYYTAQIIELRRELQEVENGTLY